MFLKNSSDKGLEPISVKELFWDLKIAERWKQAIQKQIEISLSIHVQARV